MQVLNKRACVGIWLRGAGMGHAVTLREAMMITVLGTALPGRMSSARMVISA
jgi:hypothetical protein